MLVAQAWESRRGDRRRAQQLAGAENGCEVYPVSAARQAGHHHRHVQNIGTADREVGSRGKSGRERLSCDLPFCF